MPERRWQPQTMKVDDVHVACVAASEWQTHRGVTMEIEVECSQCEWNLNVLDLLGGCMDGKSKKEICFGIVSIFFYG